MSQKITEKQLNAIHLLVQGYTIMDVSYRLELRRETVVKALKGSRVAPQDLHKNPQLAEAIEHLTKGIAIEFTSDARPQAPLPARPAKAKAK